MPLSPEMEIHLPFLAAAYADCAWCTGVSLHGKMELAQRLVREFPKVFQITPMHCTPAYGQAGQAEGASEDVLADRVLSEADFQVLSRS